MYTCVCNNNAGPALEHEYQRLPFATLEVQRDSGASERDPRQLLLPILGSWLGTRGAVESLCEPQIERFFCERPSYLVVKKENCFFAESRPDLL